jgi:hypothetical protein
MSPCILWIFQGQEYTEEFLLEYQREDDGEWIRFRNRQAKEVCTTEVRLEHSDGKQPCLVLVFNAYWNKKVFESGGLIKLHFRGFGSTQGISNSK